MKKELRIINFLHFLFFILILDLIYFYNSVPKKNYVEIVLNQENKFNDPNK